MAKKGQKIEPLTLQEIILRGDSETIRQALEARIQIDTLLEEREAAYRRIAELETQVSEIVGEDGVFPFPAPPLEVATYTQKPAPKKKVATAPLVAAEPETEANAELKTKAEPSSEKESIDETASDTEQPNKDDTKKNED
jgi:hypothetical protein